jgi:hypothetical protein
MKILFTRELARLKNGKNEHFHSRLKRCVIQNKTFLLKSIVGETFFANSAFWSFFNEIFFLCLSHVILAPMVPFLSNLFLIIFV